MREQSVNGGFLTVETFYGLSTDTKPSNTANGSKFLEMDTGKEYRFDYANSYWHEYSESGGGGGSGSDPLVIYAVASLDAETGDVYVTADKTTDEVFEAVSSDQPIMLFFAHDYHMGLLARGYIATIAEDEIVLKADFWDDSEFHPYIVFANSNGTWNCSENTTGTVTT